MIKNAFWYPVFVSDLNKTCIFSIDFRENIQIWNLMKICPVGAELFHAEWQTVRHDEANSRLSQFFERA